MSSKHTPGPWRQSGLLIYGEGNYNIAAAKPFMRPRTVSPDDAVSEARANARLIAAAPEMLAALRLVFEGGDILDRAAALGAFTEITQVDVAYIRALLSRIDGQD